MSSWYSRAISLNTGRASAEALLHLGRLLDVLLGRDALHGAQGALQRAHLLLGHLDDLARGDAELGAPGGAHHHGHVLLYVQIARIEP